MHSPIISKGEVGRVYWGSVKCQGSIFPHLSDERLPRSLLMPKLPLTKSKGKRKLSGGPKSLPEHQRISPASTLVFTDHATPPHGPASTSARRSRTGSVIKYCKATLKVLGEISSAPLGSFIQQMEVSANAFIEQKSTHFRIGSCL